MVESVIEVTNNDASTGSEGTGGKTEEGQTFSFEESKFGLIEVQEEEEEMDSDAAKPFECELCKKQFTKIEILKRHIKTHLKDKVCVCGLQSLIATCFVYFCRNSNAHTVPKPSTEETF